MLGAFHFIVYDANNSINSACPYDEEFVLHLVFS